MIRIGTQMKTFQDAVSPLSWALIYLGFLPSFYFVFRPSWSELLIYVFVEIVLTPVVIILEKKSLLEKNPEFKQFYSGLEMESLSSCTNRQKRELVETLFRFPEVRAFHATFFSYVKAAVASVVVIFLWEYDGPWYQQAILYFLSVSLIYTYFYSVLVQDNHELCSRTLRNIHECYDWTETFKKADVPQFDIRNYLLRLKIPLFGIWIFMTALILALFQFHGLNENNTVVQKGVLLEVLVVSSTGLLWFSHVWLFSQKFVLEGMGSILSVFEGEQVGTKKPRQTLPYHTSPVLANFEKTTNDLISRLKEFESELSRWVFSYTDRNRFHQIGEYTALIVHDLKGPIQTITFCAHELAETRSQNKYVRQIEMSVQRADELLNSLRAYLKNPEGRVTNAYFKEAWEYAIKLLKLQMPGIGLIKINTDFSSTLNLQIPYPDLVHVLLNLIGNSVEDLLRNQILEPSISIHAKSENGKACFVLEDNGTGLSPERFEKLTAFAYMGSGTGEAFEGLGLRLTRRVVESNNGKLEVLNPSQVQGTQFRLTLPIATSLTDQEELIQPGLAFEPTEKDIKEKA